MTGLFPILLAVLALALLGYWIGRQRGLAMRRGLTIRIGTVHSLPVYHGLYVALTALLPAVLVLAGWAIVEERLVADRVIAAVPVDFRPVSEIDRGAFMNDVRGLANNSLEAAFNPAATAVVPL